MKKSFLAILMAVALVTPVFATEKGSMEADVKLGYKVSSSVSFGEDSGGTDKTFVLGADFYYYVIAQLAVGVGVNNFFDAKADYGFDDKFGCTNIYVSVKPKLDLKSDIFNSTYLICQLGYGFFRLDYDESYQPDVDNGLYYGIGAGVEIKKNFIFELLYTQNKATAQFNGPGVGKADIKYSTFSLNLGYKFNF